MWQSVNVAMCQFANVLVWKWVNASIGRCDLNWYYFGRLSFDITTAVSTSTVNLPKVYKYTLMVQISLSLIILFTNSAISVLPLNTLSS